MLAFYQGIPSDTAECSSKMEMVQACVQLGTAREKLEGRMASVDPTTQLGTYPFLSIPQTCSETSLSAGQSAKHWKIGERGKTGKD